MMDMMQVDSRQSSEVNYLPELAGSNAETHGDQAAAAGSAAQHLGGAALHPKQQQH